ncbi:MAG: PKD domain-containing protein [Nitrospiraceae bacterium]|nr:PKD domain-containing protein [Nitrospiraceae bacterium]
MRTKYTFPSGLVLVAVLTFLFSFVPFPDAGAAMLTSAPVPLIALPYDDPTRIEAPPIISVQGTIQTLSAVITVNYLPSGATGQFGDPCLAWPAGAQDAFSYAASIWSTQISSSVPIVIEACWTNMGSPYILGHGGGNYALLSRAPYGYSFYPDALANALSGADGNGGSPEIAVAFNSAFNWYFGTTGSPPSGYYDFASVVLHEIGHGLGFAGSMNFDNGNPSDGTECDGINGDGCWGWSGYPALFDRFADNGSGQGLINTAFFLNPSAALGAQLTSNNVYFDGPNADAANTANGSGPVKLYAPGAWSAGSSYAHLDYATFSGTENALMVYAIPSQTVRHSPGPVTLCLLKDLGWTVPATCDTIDLSSHANSFGYGGGTGTVGTLNGGCCDWTAVSNDSWLHVTSGSSGKGIGVVGYSVDPYAGAVQRTGTLTIAGITYTVTQAGLPPVAGFSFTPLAAGGVPHNVFFSDTSTGAATWLWDFGDGGTSNLQNPAHTYTAVGTGSYSVSLTVSNPSGTDVVSHTVSVSSCGSQPVMTMPAGVPNSGLQAAYSVTSNNAIIEMQAVTLTGPFDMSRSVSVTLEGGYDCEYSADRIDTVLNGLVTIEGDASLVMDGIIIQ